MEKKRTLWPYGILLIIVLGIIFISISIRISFVQSIAPDLAFDEKKLFVDENINELMNIQNRFESVYTAYIGINEKPTHDKDSIIKSPYYVRPPAPKTEPSESIKLKNDSNKLIIELLPRDLGDNNAYPSIKSASLEFVRLDLSSKDVQSIKVPMEHISFHDNVVSIESNLFSLPAKGFYQARFTLHFVGLDSTNADSKENVKQDEKTAYFYHWVFNV